MNKAYKLAKFIDSGLNSDIRDILVTKEAPNKYTLFGKYTIILNRRGFYKVFSTKTMMFYEFSTLKIATAWCVFDQLSRYSEGRRLESLDLKLSSISTDIAIHKNMIRSTVDPNAKYIYITKLQEDNHKRRQTLEEINFYINNSRILQEQKFRSKAPKFNYL